MVKSYGYTPSRGSIPIEKPSKGNGDPRAVIKAQVESLRPKAKRQVPPPEATALLPNGEEKPKDPLHAAVGVTLGYVRGNSELNRETASLLLNERNHQEVVYRVSQALGRLGVSGTELTTAQENLAQIRTSAEAVLAEQLHDQTDDSL